MIEVVIERAHLYGEVKALISAILLASLALIAFSKLRRVAKPRLSVRGLLNVLVEPLAYSLKVGGLLPLVTSSLYAFHLLLVPTLLLHSLILLYILTASMGLRSVELAECLLSFEPSAGLRVLLSILSAVALSTTIWWRFRRVGFRVSHFYSILVLVAVLTGISSRLGLTPMELHVYIGYAVLALTPIRLFRHFLIDVEVNVFVRYLPRRQEVEGLLSQG